MSPVASVQRCLITPPRPTFSGMKITFTPGSESRDRMSRVPSLEPSSPTSTSSVRPVSTATTSRQQPFDRRAFVVDGDEDAEGLGRGHSSCGEFKVGHVSSCSH